MHTHTHTNTHTNTNTRIHTYMFFFHRTLNIMSKQGNVRHVKASKAGKRPREDTENLVIV